MTRPGERRPHEHMTWQRLERFLLRTETPEERDPLFHLLSTCDVCRSACEPLLELYDAGRISIFVSWQEVEAAASEWRAPKLWQELEQGLLEGVDSYADTIERLRGDDRWPTWGLVVYLARSAEDKADDEPEEAMRRAKLAGCGSFNLPEEGSFDEDWQAELQAYALAVLADLLRRQGETAEADWVFEAARERYEAFEEPADFLPFRFRVYELEADLCREQGRYGRARRLLDRALDVVDDFAPVGAGDVVRLQDRRREAQKDVDGLVERLASLGPWAARRAS